MDSFRGKLGRSPLSRHVSGFCFVWGRVYLLAAFETLYFGSSTDGWEIQHTASPVSFGCLLLAHWIYWSTLKHLLLLFLSSYTSAWISLDLLPYHSSPSQYTDHTATYLSFPFLSPAFSGPYESLLNQFSTCICTSFKLFWIWNFLLVSRILLSCWFTKLMKGLYFYSYLHSLLSPSLWLNDERFAFKGFLCASIYQLSWRYFCSVFILLIRPLCFCCFSISISNSSCFLYNYLLAFSADSFSKCWPICWSNSSR